MPITITATAGDGSANSYVTEAEFIAYAAERLNVPSGTTVSGSTCTEDEKKALIEATRTLSYLEWKGHRVDETQALSWPRQYVEDPDAPIASAGDSDYPYFASTVVPDRVKSAEIELALEFLKAGTRDIAAAHPDEGVIEKTIDVMTTKWDGAAARPTGLAAYPRVLQYIEPMLDPAAQGGLTIVRT